MPNFAVDFPPDILYVYNAYQTKAMDSIPIENRAPKYAVGFHARKKKPSNPTHGAVESHVLNNTIRFHSRYCRSRVLSYHRYIHVEDHT